MSDACGLGPRIGRMSELGQRATFSTVWRYAWNAAESRHSAPKVGYAPVSGRSGETLRTSALCQQATLLTEAIEPLRW